MPKKVTVVGGGFVGSTIALQIIDRGLADVVLTDILEDVPAGKALMSRTPKQSRIGPPRRSHLARTE